MIIGPLSFSLIRFTVSSLIMIILLWRIEGNPFIKRKISGILSFRCFGFWNLSTTMELWSSINFSIPFGYSALNISIVVVLIAYFKKEENVEWYNFLELVLDFRCYLPD